MVGIEFYRELSLPLFLVLTSCASDDVLFADYSSRFCEAPTSGVSEKQSQKMALDKVGKSVVADYRAWFPAVYFDHDSSDLGRGSVSIISRNAKFLNENSAYKVSIRGFADERGSEAYNARLSAKRVGSVLAQFKQAGIAEQRIYSMAHGESFAFDMLQPVDAKMIDRRVEMVLLDNRSQPATTYQPDSFAIPEFSTMPFFEAQKR